MADAITSIADVFVPEKSIPAVAERSAKGSRLITSGAVVRSPQLDAFAASVGALTVKIPGWAPLRNRSQVQKENVTPETKKATQGLQIATILERVLPTAVTALSRQRAIESGDPLAFLVNSVSDNRQFDQQGTLVSMLRGIYGSAAFAPLVKNAAVEVAGDVGAGNLIDSDLMDDTSAKLGENKSDLEAGYAFMHSVIETELTKQERITVIRNSEGKIVLKSYRGLQVFVCDDLARPGTTSGTVYETYLLAPGRIAMGQAPQSNKVGDVSSLTVKEDAGPNNITIFDRFRYLLALYGAKYIGELDEESATDLQLADPANWTKGITDIQGVGVVQLLTNG